MYLLPDTPPTHYNLRDPQPLRPRASRLTMTYNSYFPSTTRAWNLLPDSTRNVQSATVFKQLICGTNKFNPYHRLCTNKYGIWLSCIRMGLSALNYHRYQYNFINSPICTSCNDANETAYHYFISCTTYQMARQTFFHNLFNLLGINTANNPNLLNTILEGHHIHPWHHAELLSIVTNYLSDTGRFL